MLVDKYVDDKKDPFAIVTYMPELDGIQINQQNSQWLLISIKIIILPKFHFCLNAHLNLFLLL